MTEPTEHETPSNKDPSRLYKCVSFIWRHDGLAPRLVVLAGVVAAWRAWLIAGSLHNAGEFWFTLHSNTFMQVEAASVAFVLVWAVGTAVVRTGLWGQLPKGMQGFDYEIEQAEGKAVVMLTEHVETLKTHLATATEAIVGLEEKTGADVTRLKKELADIWSLKADSPPVQSFWGRMLGR